MKFLGYSVIGLLTFDGLISEAQEPEFTYAQTIAPIIQNQCVICHHDGGIGPFALTNYEEVKKRARQIAEVTHSRYMPPWKPDIGYGPPLQGERRLTDEQIEIIDQWVEAGSPSGDLSQIAQAPGIEKEWILGEPDLIIDLEEAYTLPAEGLDVYRNFVIPLPIEETVYVRAFELLPQTRLAIHHALLMLDPTERSRQQDAAEGGPGYDGMGIGSSVPPSGHIVGWTPGQIPYQAYPGTAWEVTPGTDLVLQLHMLPSGKEESINPKIGLYLSDEPPTKPSFVFQLRSYELEIPAGDPDYLVEQSIEVTAPLKVISVYPHAHYIGKDLQLFAILPDGEKQWLLRISDWDFNWQGDYRYAEPPVLPKGSVIHMSYHFDNSADNINNPNDPPKDILGGWRSEDEMAEAMIQVMPIDPADLPKLQTAQKDYDFKLAGGEARFHYFSAIYLEQQNEFERAMTAYQNALRLDPGFASAYYRMGALFEQQGNIQQAEALYEEALAYQPDLISARLAVAKLMMQRNQIRSAGFILEEVYSNNPDHLSACLYLARYHLARGETAAAIKIFEEGESNFSESPQFHLDYGLALLTTDREAAQQRFILATNTVPEHPAQGALQPINWQHAEAHYQLALIFEEDGDEKAAAASLDACLRQNADHLDALLKSANYALRNDDRDKARNRLYALINRPAKDTFSYYDILGNLELPSGASVLADAYQAIGSEAIAADALAYAIQLLADRGTPGMTHPLKIKLKSLRP
jgi:tetratricopeptide (TPR) repeat protein/mono/diheme cytochrome c family protein